MRFGVIAVSLCFLGGISGYSASAAAKTPHSCIRFSVLTQDALKNVKMGLSPKDQKWFRKKVEKKYPSVCYAPPSPGLPLVFVVIVTPATYHGTRIVTDTETHDNPVNGTITDDAGNTADVSGTEQSTTTSRTAVPYSFDYGIFTLSVEQQRKDGSFVVLRRFQQKGIYHTMYGIPLGGKGHHPFHAVIQEAAEWIGKGGLAQAEKMYADSPEPTSSGSSQASNAPKSQPVANAILEISSSPEGAEIDIDGTYVGNTPGSLQVTPGKHLIALKLAGRASWERNITAMPGHVSISPELQPVENQAGKQ